MFIHCGAFIVSCLYSLFEIFTDLPQKREIECEAGIKIEIRFEHQNWLSNAIVLCLRVIDLGEAKFCDVGLMLECLPQVKWYISIFSLLSVYTIIAQMY